LKVYSDEKRKDGVWKGFSDKELIANMFAYIFSIRKIDKAWIDLYRRKEKGFHEGGVELEILNREFRLADIDPRRMKYVWRNPNILEFYMQARKIAFSHLKYGLCVRGGRNALERYSFEEIKKKYRDSYLNL
jgi:hypothetical protein